MLCYCYNNNKNSTNNRRRLLLLLFTNISHDTLKQIVYLQQNSCPIAKDDLIDRVLQKKNKRKMRKKNIKDCMNTWIQMKLYVKIYVERYTVDSLMISLTSDLVLYTNIL